MGEDGTLEVWEFQGAKFSSTENWVQISSYIISSLDEYVNRIMLKGELTEPYDNTDVDYENTIQELYVVAPIDNGYKLGIKYYSETQMLYLRPYMNNGQYTWQSSINISDWTNGKVYELKCSEAYDGINVGDVVGYIIFKDINKFKDNSFSGYGVPVYCSYVTNISNFPIIYNYLYPAKIADNSVTSAKIADNSVTSAKIVDGSVTSTKIANGSVTSVKIANILFADNTDNNEYAHNVLELWINPKYRDSETEGLNYYFKITNNLIYLRPYINRQTPYIWNAIASLPSAESYHNTPIAIKCNVAGGGVNVDDVVGYVVFKNTKSWSSSNSSLGVILTDDVFNIGNAPIIYTDLLNQETVGKIPVIPDVQTMEKGVEVILPNVITVTVGDTLQLFYRACIRCFNPYVYDVVTICSVGKNYPRYYTLTAENAHVGNAYQLTLQVKRNDGSVIASGQTQIKVIAAMTQPSSNKNILCVGASATAGGQWVGEVKRRLTETSGDGTPYNPKGLGLSNITFVGRKTGKYNPVNLEATGGWTWSAFSGQGRPAYRFQVSGVSQLNMDDIYSVNGVTLTITEINVTEGSGNIRCTYSGNNEVPASGILTRVTGTGDESITYSSVESESFNPFWNNGKLDFKNYANLYCNGSIDLLITHLGVNDIFGNTAAETLVESYVKPFVRAFHADFPNGKVIISSLPLPDCTGGMGANYGATAHNYYTRAQLFWDYAKEFNALGQDSEFSPYVSIAEVLQEFDNEYSYPKTEASVNNRSTLTENLGTNGVHPTEQGSYLVADTIYRICNSIQF